MTTPEEVRRQLGELTAMQKQTRRSDQEIRRRAMARLETVSERLAALAPADGDEREKLVEERGRLHRILAAPPL